MRKGVMNKTIGIRIDDALYADLERQVELESEKDQNQEPVTIGKIIRRSIREYIMAHPIEQKDTEYAA